jgi:hypothetical protein
METPNTKKNTYNRETYLKNKDAIYKSIRKYATKNDENKERIAKLKKNFYEKKKDDPEYKKQHSEAMKKYYQKRKLLKIEQEKLKIEQEKIKIEQEKLNKDIPDKEIEENIEYIYHNIQFHENK